MKKNLISLLKETNKKGSFYFQEEKKWKEMPFNDFFKKVKILTVALRNLGLKENDKLVIIGNSSPYWLLIDYASLLNKAITVPIFPTVSYDNLVFKIKETKAEFFFCNSQEDLLKISEFKYNKIIVNFEDFNCKKKDKNIIHINELLKEEYNKEEYNKLYSAIDTNDIFTIIYTSGSTGKPKGVMITQDNLVSQIQGADKFFKLKTEYKALSFLPLAHIFERMIVNFYLYKDVNIYMTNDMENLVSIIREIKPDLMTTVPRLIEKIYDSIKIESNKLNFLFRNISNLTIRITTSLMPNIFLTKFLFPLFNILLYRKILDLFGGNIKMIICGGASLSTKLEIFFNNCGIKIFSGYGMTETAPVISTNTLSFHKIGSVGKAFYGVDIKLLEDGEIVVKGRNLMKGYFNDKKATLDNIDSDGYFHTGDLAKIDKEGYVFIIGRKKEMLKTSVGKFVSPVPIEKEILFEMEIIDFAVVIAESKKFPSVLLFTNHQIDENDNQNIQKKIKIINQKLNKWEKIRKFKIINELPSVECGDLTPSQKIIRYKIEKKYQKIIEEMYQK